MKKVSSILPSVLASLATTTVLVLGIFTVATVYAANGPTQAPPGGNPTFPLQGAAGPAGANGGANCTTKSNACAAGQFCTTTADGSYVVTGAGCWPNNQNGGVPWSNVNQIPMGPYLGAAGQASCRCGSAVACETWIVECHQ